MLHLTLVISEKTVKVRKDLTLAEVESLKISVEVGGGKEQVCYMCGRRWRQWPGQARPTCQLSEKKGVESERKRSNYTKEPEEIVCVSFHNWPEPRVSSFFSPATFCSAVQAPRTLPGDLPTLWVQYKRPLFQGASPIPPVTRTGGINGSLSLSSLWKHFHSRQRRT